MKKPKDVIVKTGTAIEFMEYVKSIMRVLDKEERIKPLHTLMFEDPIELFQFLSEKNTEVC